MEVKSCLKLCYGLAGVSYILSQKKWNIDYQADTLNLQKYRFLRQKHVNAETKEGRKPIVLVVGAGLTGCLVTYLARKKVWRPNRSVRYGEIALSIWSIRSWSTI